MPRSDEKRVGGGQCGAADAVYPVRRQATSLEGSEEDVRQPQKVRHASVEGLFEYTHRPRGGVFPSKLDVASSSLVSRSIVLRRTDAHPRSASPCSAQLGRHRGAGLSADAAPDPPEGEPDQDEGKGDEDRQLVPLEGPVAAAGLIRQCFRM